MLAGAGGIDLVLFVIAADESIKPQTREHFDICRLLNVPKGIVVLTKADLVDSDILELVRLEVDEFVRGSFLENAPRGGRQFHHRAGHRGASRGAAEDRRVMALAKDAVALFPPADRPRFQHARIRHASSPAR